MRRMPGLKPPKTKTCCRCEQTKKLKKFRWKIKERISGHFIWIYPWCKECLIKVKEEWGTNWRGNQDGEKEKKKANIRIPSVSQRKSNTKSNIQRVKRTVSKHRVKRRRTNIQHNRRPGRVQSGSKSGIVDSLQHRTAPMKTSILYFCNECGNTLDMSLKSTFSAAPIHGTTFYTCLTCGKLFIGIVPRIGNCTSIWEFGFEDDEEQPWILKYYIQKSTVITTSAPGMQLSTTTNFNDIFQKIQSIQFEYYNTEDKTNEKY